MHGLGFNRFAAKYLSRVKVDSVGTLPQVSTPWYINQFVSDYYALMNRNPGQVWPVIGGNQAAHMIDLFGKYNLSTWGAGVVTHDTNGMLSDGNSGCAISVSSLKNIFPDINTWTFGFYSRTELASDTKGEMGGIGGVGKMAVNPRNAAGLAQFYLGTSTLRAVSCPSSRGLFTIRRYPAGIGYPAAGELYRNGVVVAGYVEVSSGIPSAFTILHATGWLWSGRQQSFIFCMPAYVIDPAAQYTLVQNLQTHCGRAV